MLAAVTRPSPVLALTVTIASLWVAGIVECTNRAAVTFPAVRKAEVVYSTLVTVKTSVILLARALPTTYLTLASHSASLEAVTRLTLRVVIVTLIALLTIWRKEGWTTLTAP